MVQRGARAPHSAMARVHGRRRVRGRFAVPGAAPEEPGFQLLQSAGSCGRSGRACSGVGA